MIVASDENHNLLILDDNCHLLQSLPYGKKISDAVASDKHIFVGIEFRKVLIIEKKKPFTVIEKIDCKFRISSMAMNERNEVRVCGERGLSFYIKTHDFSHYETSFRHRT